MVVVYSLPFFNMCGIDMLYYFKYPKKVLFVYAEAWKFNELQKVGDLVRKLLIWYLTI